MRKTGELTVITKTKDLCAYVFTVTDSSPKKFRFTYVSRLQNCILDALEYLMRANMVRVVSTEDAEHITQRRSYQREAYVSLRLLGQLAQIAQESGCILPKQYAQISLRSAEAIRLLIAWGKSDRRRYKG